MQVFRLITDLGRSHLYLMPAGLGALLFAILASRVGDPRKRQALASLALACGFVFVAVASTGLLTTALKYLIGRPRPKLLDQEGTLGLSPLGLDADFASFPSGHANTAVAIALCLILLWPRYWVPLTGFAIVIGFSRVAVGAHYPSDVIAGGYLAIVTTAAWRRTLAGERLVFMPAANGAIVVRGQQIRRWLANRLRAQVRLVPVVCRGWLRGLSLAGEVRDDQSG